MQRRTHRSHVSYMDKSREYYRAHGYDNAYAWAHHDDVPFTPLGKPLAQSRVAICTTADRAPRAQGRGARHYAEPLASASRLHREMFWDRDATHTDDPETYLPLASLTAHRDAGRIASISRRFYGVATEYSQRKTLNEDAPELEAWLREDAVDVAVLVAL
jgi:hypothetical protein